MKQDQSLQFEYNIISLSIIIVVIIVAALQHLKFE